MYSYYPDLKSSCYHFVIEVDNKNSNIVDNNKWYISIINDFAWNFKGYKEISINQKPCLILNHTSPSQYQYLYFTLITYQIFIYQYPNFSPIKIISNSPVIGFDHNTDSPRQIRGPVKIYAQNCLQAPAE